MTKLFLYLLNNEPNDKVLDKKEISKLKKYFLLLKKIKLLLG